MTLAEELLNSLTYSDAAMRTSEIDAEGHIVIDEDRYITVPDELKRLAVQYDHNIETVTFDCPRYWDDVDMSEMRIYINYSRADDYSGCYEAKNIHIDESDETIMHFDWTITRNVTDCPGKIKFLVCIKTADEEGNETTHWNSELCSECYISKGLECDETLLEQYPDIIYQLKEEITAKLAAEIPTVDSTLTQSGQAADAAAVGGRLSALSEEIANVADEVEALASLSECGIITPAYQNGAFYTDADGAIYVL